jgi:dihydrolipoamide dehydrogenase
VVKKIDTTLAVLGGGPAGYVAAIRAAQLGADVVLIENKELGGVCMNRGCIPTKALLRTSEIVSILKKSKEFGIEDKGINIKWDVSNERKNRVVKSLGLGLDQLLPKSGVTVLKGRGTIQNPKMISVWTQEEEIEVHCAKMIITTGARPLVPDIENIHSEGVLTSNEALHLEKVPESMVIIGAGVIGLEFATMFSAVGSKVTILEMMDRILPIEDTEIATELLKIMKRQGISFKLAATVQRIEQTEDGLEVHYIDKDKNLTLSCEKILVAVGRKLNSDSEDFKKLGLNINNGALVVNENMETNIEGVYAAGDVIGGNLLAHLAFMEGKTAAENALGIAGRVNYNAVPACIYTNPEVASVGMTEEEASSAGIKVKVGRFQFRNNGRALCLGERDGFVKIVVEMDNTIIGGQILGANASEMISEITLAITLKAKADTIADMIHPHPSLNEAVWEACADAVGRAIHKI